MQHHAMERSSQGRVVRWDTVEATGAVVVEGEAAEIEVSGDVVRAARPLQPGELVDVRWLLGNPDDGEPARAVEVVPVDG